MRIHVGRPGDSAGAHPRSVLNTEVQKLGTWDLKYLNMIAMKMRPDHLRFMFYIAVAITPTKTKEGTVFTTDTADIKVSIQ